MRTKWFIVMGAGILLFAGLAYAQNKEPEKDQTRSQVRNENQAQDPQGETYRHRNRLQHRNNTENQNMQKSNQTTPFASDDSLVETKSDGVTDRLRKRDRVGDGQANQQAMKRGRHRNRNANLSGQGQGTLNDNRSGKGFGESYIDADGDGVCDHHQRRAKKRKSGSGPVQQNR